MVPSVDYTNTKYLVMLPPVDYTNNKICEIFFTCHEKTSLFLNSWQPNNTIIKSNVNRCVFVLLATKQKKKHNAHS